MKILSPLLHRKNWGEKSLLAKDAVTLEREGMLPEERDFADNLVVQYSSGRFGVSADYLRSADAIEVKIGQGAKPGMGGHPG